MNRIFQISHPVVFGHRGASAYAPENTMASFLLAKEHGADAIEFDVKLSADGEIVVMHDQTLNRTTNGKGKVRDFPLAALNKLDAGSSFSADFAGEPIPTLRVVLETLGDQIYYNIELTNYGSIFDDLAKKAASLVMNFGLEDNVLFSSFSPLALFQAKRTAPNVPVALIGLRGLEGKLAHSFIFRGVSPEIVNPFISNVTKEFVDRQHSIGRRVNPWTVNTPDDFHRLCQLGVDGMITDDPLMLRKLLDGE
jgi:glycerophosphoryl diester phosphodiesterase